MWKTAKIFNFWNTLQDCASNMNCSNIEVINLNFNVCIARQSMLIMSRILQCVENNDTTSRTLINMAPNQNVSPWNGSLRLSSAVADCFASVSPPLQCIVMTGQCAGYRVPTLLSTSSSFWASPVQCQPNATLVQFVRSNLVIMGWCFRLGVHRTM